MGFKSYVAGNPDLKAAFENSGSKSAAAWGKRHWERHGKNEHRQVTPQNTKNASAAGGSPEYDLTQSGRVTANDSYGATRVRQNYTRQGAVMAAQSDSLYQQGASYDWKVTGALEDLPRRRGMFGSRRAEKRIPMMLEGTKGYARVENINEKDQSKWKFIWQPTLNTGGARFDQMEGPPDVYLGELFSKKAAPTPTRTPPVVNTDSGGGGGGGGGQAVAAGVTALQKQYEDAIFKLQRSVSGVPADAPSWVKTHADYLRWLRIRSSEGGYQSTIVTSPSGVSSSNLLSGVRTKSLMAGP